MATNRPMEGVRTQQPY